MLLNTTKLLTVVASMLMLCSASRAQDAAAVKMDLEAGDARVVETSSDHIRIALHVLARTHQRAKIVKVVLSNAYFNGMPVFLSPLEEPFELAPEEFIQLPGELMATVYYRDVDSPDPLQQLLQNSSVTIDAEATITAQLNLVEKVALMSSTATSKTAIHAVVPVSLPGGDLARTAALTVLQASRPLFGKAQKASAAVGIGPKPDPWCEERKQRFGGSLLYVVSHYQLRDKHGAVADYTYAGTGFRISPSHFVVLREAVEPWEFDSGAMSRMKSEGAKVVDDTRDIVVYAPGAIPDGTQPGMSLAHGDFHLVSSGKDDRKRVFVKSDKGYKKGHMDERVSEGNIAVFELAMPVIGGTMTDFAGDSDAIDPVAILRFRSPVSGQPLEVEALPLHVTRSGDVLQLSDPVDARYFGSPVLVSSGILAVVQDERSASLLRPSLKRVGYTLAGDQHGRAIACSDSCRGE